MVAVTGTRVPSRPTYGSVTGSNLNAPATGPGAASPGLALGAGHLRWFLAFLQVAGLLWRRFALAVGQEDEEALFARRGLVAEGLRHCDERGAEVGPVALVSDGADRVLEPVAHLRAGDLIFWKPRETSLALRSTPPGLTRWRCLVS